MPSPIFLVFKLLLDPNVNNKIVLQAAYGQLKVIGLAKVLSALAGGAIVGVSSFIRVPQIRKIITPRQLDDRIKVANGLSLESLGLETFNQLVHVVFNKQNNSAFTSYGESLLLGLQNVVIILLIKYYRLVHAGEIDNLQHFTLLERVGFVGTKLLPAIAAIAGTSIFFTKIAPTGLVLALQVVGIPISIVSKIPQIQRNHALKSTLSLSNITIRANLLGSALRVFTSVQDYNTKARRKKNTVNDKVLVAGYTASLAMNSILVGQSVVYKNRKSEETEEKKD
ncbi:mannose-P-dolichol utilization defect 1 protein [Suhomyces tanzawaensis NRRL Y-17324]|uniref:Solute carrier family 66 member 3 n=1 Tax=Suhomyces tanzawaensis NRRL Y-17324 TaxID=984487 RepID=A0A1E4SQJ0_9ASCO|nr:mannose-P-dolichol utilization defect 1 protein [Suhomyces tanzawaensis NRRL Y-17324]ODV81776.1 mannose-P-dolichol utilization defect 1 protein [Suhomyces tanzawaensis NRRL Y-17324]